jgi:antitoxin component YwqK of YwqJK toxin-antitoxin module
METKIERAYWSDGQPKSEHPYVGGTPHGVYKWWWESGQLRSERSYVGGVRHGLTKYWWQSGQLELEVPYVGGVRHGMEKSWWENGDIAEFRLWNQDKLVAKFNPKNKTQRWKLK